MRKVNEYLKTTILLAGLTALIMSMSYMLGGTSALLIGFGIALVMNAGAYWFSDRMVLAMAGAQELPKDQYIDLHDDIKRLSHKMKIPVPKLYMSADMQPNAFATGRDPKHGVVCVTRGLIEGLDQDEIRGVLAHELAHIKNYDILTSTIAAVLAGAISSVAEMMFWFGGANRDEDNANPLSMVGSIMMLILAPVAAMLLQFAISRTREYAADAMAAEYTKDPKALARALIKIQHIAENHPMQHNPAISSLYIQNPGGLQGIQELFSTHPLTQKRVERLMKI